MAIRVDTIIIGAGRSGTTSVYEYLAAHPQVNFSITKELHYFSLPDLFARGEGYFHSLFENKKARITATADTYLLVDKAAPERLRKYNPDMRIIVMLRDPVERAYSNFNYSVQYGHEKPETDFLETIQHEQGIIQRGDIVEINNRCHCYGSLYYQHLHYWMQYFPKEQFIIHQLNELKSDPDAFYKQLCRQLSLDYFPFDHAAESFNRSSGVKSKWLQQLLLNRNSKLRKMISFCLRPFRNIIIRSGIIDKVYALNRKEVKIIPLNAEQDAVARAYFKEDLQKLKEELGIVMSRK